MPAFSAAVGSFHAKSWVTYLVSVLTTSRVLPCFLTVTLIRSVTLAVSTLGARSYNDQRYWSMHTSGSGQASRTSNELAAGLLSCIGSAGGNAASIVGGRIGSGLARPASPLPMSTISKELAASAISFCTASGVFGDAIRTGGVVGVESGSGSCKA